MRYRSRGNPRGGSILPLTVLVLIALVGFVALSIDLGLIMIGRNQAQNGWFVVRSLLPAGWRIRRFPNRRLLNPQAKTQAMPMGV